MNGQDIFELRRLGRDIMHGSQKDFIEMVEALLIKHIINEDSILNRRLDRIEHKINTIMAKQADEAVALQAIADDLVKVRNGIDALKQSIADLTAQLANVETTPEVDAALANVQANLATVDADLPPAP